MEIKGCPHCGGKARLTGRDIEFVGHKGSGEKYVRYRLRVICNHCNSTGKPVTTEPTAENFWSWLRHGVGTFYDPYAEQAISAWNKRA